MAAPDTLPSAAPPANGRRTLTVCGAAHALHDGYTDLLNVLFPLLQAQFGLSYAAIGGLRATYSTAMAVGQIPSGLAAERFGGPLVLALGTALAAIGYLVAGYGGGLAGVALGILLSGLGSSAQHPVGSSLVAGAYAGLRSRAALGTYNFTGDLGKMLIPAAFAAMATFLPWRASLVVVGGLGLALAVILPLALAHERRAMAASRATAATPESDAPAGRLFTGPFNLLLTMQVVDSLTRAGFLTFLPFLLQSKGANLATIGLALSLLFAGGAAGKLACGWLGDRWGVLPTVFATEFLTAAGIVALIPLPLDAALVLLPLVGIALNGTSSVLYGTVPEFVAPERRTRAFSVFYTGGSVAGATGPILYGALGDTIGLTPMLMVVSAVALLSLPLVWALRPALRAVAAR